jgi:alkaline phosphatase D
MTAHQAPLSRRELLAWAGAAGTAIWLPRAGWSQTRQQTQLFGLGIASGSPLSDSVVLWTRLLFTPGQGAPDLPVSVRWEIAHDGQFTKLAQSGVSPALPSLGWSVHAEVQGLEPDRWYFYRFIVGDAVSPTGRTRTLPAADALVSSLRLAYASCQRWETGFYSAYRHMLADRPDLVMFLGDYIYEYPNSPNPVRKTSGGWVTTLDDYRARYALHKSDADLQAMHAACPWLVTWDDHEVQNDYAGLSPGDNGPAVPDFAARRAAAYQAYYENMPLRSSVLTQGTGGLARGAEMRIHDRLQYGRLASLYLLDARQYKDRQVCTREAGKASSSVNPASCPEWHDLARSLLGMKQEAWLNQEFGKSSSRKGWNVIGQQSVFGPRDYKRGPGESLWNDGWDGYGAARQRLTGALQKHAVASPVLFGGDVHENWVGCIKADYTDPASKAIGVEFCGTSITSRSAGNDKIADVLAENPHFMFADSARRGYGLAEFTPKSLTTSLRVVSDVTLVDSGVETLATFVVGAGRNLVERG